jgi:hypothetical protein
VISCGLFLSISSRQCRLGPFHQDEDVVPGGATRFVETAGS